MAWISDLLRSFAKPFQWWVTVAAWEQGVLVRLGKRTHHLRPGIYFRMPFLDRVVCVCTRVRAIDTDCRTVTTSQGKSLTVGLSIFYAIDDASALVQSIARPEATLKSLALAIACDTMCEPTIVSVSSVDLGRIVTDALADRGRSWGLRDLEVRVTTFAICRTIRLLQAHDNGYSGFLDTALDQKPVAVS